MSVHKLFELKGRVALITGGSRGLGLQMAEALGEMGAKVAITARKQNELDEARRHLEAEGVEVMTIACDMQDLKAAQALPGQVLARWKRIDVLVNNAGTTWGAPAEEHPLEAWNKVLTLNLTAVFALTQAVGTQAMIPARYGRIVNVASIAGLQGHRSPFHAHHRLQHQQGRRRELHPFARRRVGAIRHNGERYRTGCIPEQDVPGHDRQGRAGDTWT